MSHTRSDRPASGLFRQRGGQRGAARLGAHADRSFRRARRRRRVEIANRAILVQRAALRFLFSGMFRPSARSRRLHRRVAWTRHKPVYRLSENALASSGQPRNRVCRCHPMTVTLLRMNFFLDSFPGGLLPRAAVVWVCAVWIFSAIIHIAFASAVLTDAQLFRQRFRRNTFLVGGGVWALATLLGGVFIAAIYWLIHHSTLRRQELPTDVESEFALTQPKPKPLNPEDY